MRIVRGLYRMMIVILISMTIYLIWDNKEKIISLSYNALNHERKPVIIEPNQYKRYYPYEMYNIEEDYVPQNEKDIKNIIYNFLNNGWDEFTFYCPKDYTNCIDDVKMISNDSELLSAINNYINPFNTFANLYTRISSDGTVIISIDRTYSKEMINKINKKVDKIIDKLELEKLTTKQKIRKIHDYLIDNIDYDKGQNDKRSNSTNAYGALINGIAICSGYSDAMAIFLDRLDIPNLKISSETHVWNLVYYDGKWLHLDVTWDDPIYAITDSNKYVYFLINSSKIKELEKEIHQYNSDDYLELKGE